MEQLLSESTHLLVQNEIPFASTTTYVECAARSNTRVIYNPSPVPPASSILEFPWKCVDYLLVNEGETQSLLGAFNSTNDLASNEGDTLYAPAGLPSTTDTKIVMVSCAALRSLCAVQEISICDQRRALFPSRHRAVRRRYARH